MKIKITQDTEHLGATFKKGEEYFYESRDNLVEVDYQQRGRKRWFFPKSYLANIKYKEIENE